MLLSVEGWFICCDITLFVDAAFVKCDLLEK